MAAQAPAQSTIQNVHLVGGGHFRGERLPTDGDDQRIRFRLLTGDTIELQTSSLLSFNTSHRQRLAFRDGSSIPKQGFYLLLQSGLAIGSSEESDFLVGTLAFSMSMGHRFNPHWQVGGGLGFDFYDREFLPLFTEVRWHPWQSKVSPFLSLQAGYSLGLDLYRDEEWPPSEAGGGSMLHPALGIRSASQRVGNFLLEVGYRFQRGTRQWGGESMDILSYRRIALRLGWEF